MAATELLLLRHGIALDREVAAASGISDPERPLTEEGSRRTQQVAQRLVALGLTCEGLVSSPLLRARQTAELARRAGLAPRLELAGELAPGGDPIPLLRRWLGSPEHAAARRLALVGHEPDLSGLAARLCGAPAGSLRLRKAGVAMVELPPGAGAEAPLLGEGSLILLLTPRCLRR
jgi:phosphohistidine phosphatase